MVGVWNMNFIFPFHLWDVILPIDVHSIIFQDGHIAPPIIYIYKININELMG